MHVINTLAPFVKEFIIGSWNHHFRQGSEAQLKVKRTYQNWLPVVRDTAISHMKHLFIKKELADQVKLPMTYGETQFKGCLARAEKRVI